MIFKNNDDKNLPQNIIDILTWLDNYHLEKYKSNITISDVNKEMISNDGIFKCKHIINILTSKKGDDLLHLKYMVNNNFGNYNLKICFIFNNCLEVRI